MWFRHQKSRPDLAIQERDKPFSLLRIIAILRQHLHIARIWCRAVGRLRKLFSMLQRIAS
jgi:hypothetical protein